MVSPSQHGFQQLSHGHDQTDTSVASSQLLPAGPWARTETWRVVDLGGIIAGESSPNGLLFPGFSGFLSVYNIMECYNLSRSMGKYSHQLKNVDFY